MSWGSAKSWSSVSEWPPPYINARISAVVWGEESFEGTLTLEPRNSDPPIKYFGEDLTLGLYLKLILHTTETQNQIVIYELYRYGYPPYFWASDSPPLNVQPPTFNLQNSQWLDQSPYLDTTIQVAIAYPGEP